jgi:hypothetical protein
VIEVTDLALNTGQCGGQAAQAVAGLVVQPLFPQPSRLPRELRQGTPKPRLTI